MPDKVYGYDDDSVTLGGLTNIEVDQQDADDAPDDDEVKAAFVKQSRSFSRDPRLSALSDDHTRRQVERMLARLPAGQMKKCTCALHKGARFLPIAEFSTDPNRDDGRDPFCKGCRAELAHLRRMRSAEQEGRSLRAKRQNRAVSAK